MAEKFSAYTDEQLVAEAESLYGVIHGESPCFGTRDLFRYDQIAQELEYRGFDVNEEHTLKISKAAE